MRAKQMLEKYKDSNQVKRDIYNQYYCSQLSVKERKKKKKNMYIVLQFICLAVVIVAPSDYIRINNLS